MHEIEINIPIHIGASMKLSTLLNHIPLASNNPMDIDVSSRIGPTVAKNLTDLERLAQFVSGDQELMMQIENLRKAFAACIDLQSNVLENGEIAEGLVYRLDDVDPMNNSEILVKGGAGRYSMKSLKVKAAREAAQLADMTTQTDPGYSSCLHIAKQVANTIATIVEATQELEAAVNKNRESAPVKETVPIAPLSEDTAIDYVIKMHNEMYPDLGDKSWVAISKLLKESHSNPKLIESIINKAIVRTSLL